LVLDVAALSAAGYAVLLVIASSYWAASTQPASVIVSAATGGAFVAFALVPPTYLGMAYLWAWRGRRRSGPAAQEEVPAPDEEVPSHPQPQAEQEVSAQPPPRHVPDHPTQPRIAEHDPAGFPQHERGQHDRPSHHAELGRHHAGSTYPRRRTTVGVTGWLVIIAGSATWEILSLFHYGIPTFSHNVRIIMNPPVGRAALVVAWIAIGYSLFGSEERDD
jgi:hypothetical protein